MVVNDLAVAGEARASLGVVTPASADCDVPKSAVCDVTKSSVGRKPEDFVVNDSGVVAREMGWGGINLKIIIFLKDNGSLSI